MSLPAFEPFNADHGSVRHGTGSVEISAHAATDFFTNPDGSAPIANAPGLAVAVDSEIFSLAALVHVDLKATYDAGALMVQTGDGRWAKFAFERSPLGRGTIVSVVTKDTSDDGNGEETDAAAIWLRAYREGPVIAFHWSLDGQFFKLARLFSFGSDVPGLTIGLLAQSPAGPGCTVLFDNIAINRQPLADLRNGA